MKASKEYFHGMAESYFPHPKSYLYKVELIQKYARGVVLDAGCADGIYIHRMRATANFVYGIDHTPSFARTAMLRTSHYKNVSIKEGDLLRLPWKDRTMDRIFCQSTFYYIKEQKKALKELLRVLKPGGLLIIDVRRTPGENKHIQEYPTDLQWLLNHNNLKLIEELHPPQIGLKPKIKKLFGNSMPPIITYVLRKT